MNQGSIATRYARALFEEAKAQFIDRQVYEYLGILYSNMKAAPELLTAIISPRISQEKKYLFLITACGINSEVWTKAGHAPKVESYYHTLFTRFIQLVLQHHRESHLKTMIFVYRDLFRKHYKIDRVIFECAIPANDSIKEKVIAKVKAKTGREVELVTRTKPELIGGFRLSIGDKRYDYSYATRLEIIRNKILKS